MARSPQLLHLPHIRQLHRLIKGSVQIPQGTADFGFNTTGFVADYAWHSTHIHHRTRTHKYTQIPLYNTTSQPKTKQNSQ